MFSLRWKLGGALLLVALISVGLTAFLINQNTATQFQQYVQGGNTAYAQKLSNNLEQYYARQTNWNGVQEVLNASQRTNNDRLVLADSSGNIVADTAGLLIGQSNQNLNVLNSIPLEISGRTVGTLYLDSTNTGMGRGHMGGRGIVPNTAAVQNMEEDFLARINNYIWIAGIISFVAALTLGILLTRQIIRPLRSLNTGAEHIARGELNYRVEVRSKDEIGKLAGSFNNMAIQLDSSEQSRRQLVSDVAHELRTPLTIIQGTVDGIEDGVFSPDKEHLDSIKEQTTLLSHLVNDLRDLSQAESGQLRLDLQPVDMVNLAQKKLNQFQISAQNKNIQLGLDSPSSPLEINIDATRIEQILGNLLSNAIRHTPKGGQITVSLKSIASNETGKNELIISVSDTGEGIAAEHLPHIFDRFYRVETSRSRSEGGAGLGLAIVKQMAQAHSGRVWAESQPGRGSTFHVALPYIT